MTERVSLQSAYVIHTRRYRETSLLIELFTEEFGRITAISKGVRSARSSHKGLLQPFVPLLASWVAKSDLATLSQVESAGTPYQLQGKPLISALYLNELLYRLLKNRDPHSELFKDYVTTLSALQNAEVEAIARALRVFEKRLLKAIGYALPLTHEGESMAPIESDKRYFYDSQIGFKPIESAGVSWQHNQDRVFLGRTLLDLEAERFHDPESQKQSKHLLRLAIESQLGGKPLNTRRLYSSRMSAPR